MAESDQKWQNGEKRKEEQGERDASIPPGYPPCLTLPCCRAPCRVHTVHCSLRGPNDGFDTLGMTVLTEGPQVLGLGAERVSKEAKRCRKVSPEGVLGLFLSGFAEKGGFEPSRLQPASSSYIV